MDSTGKLKPLPPATIDQLCVPNLDYDYFADAQFHPFRPHASELEMVNAWWLAEASLLAYAPAEFAIPAFEKAGLSVIGPFTGESTQCYLARGEQHAIVAFRGTRVLKPVLNQTFTEVARGVINDIWTDAKFFRVDSGQGGVVHAGFQEGLNQVWADQLKPALDELRTNQPEMTFWFTGHSLGAALSALAARRFGDVRGLYTFGSPRVGNRAYALSYPIRTFRFVNNNDQIVSIPPPGPYRHFGKLIYIHDDGKIVHDPSLWTMVTDSVAGHWSRLRGSLRWLTTTRPPEVAFDNITDHAPVYYAVHIWNNYIGQ
jgi:triacylglycerol lipase